MKKMLVLLAVTVLVFGFSLGAHASMVTLDFENPPCVGGTTISTEYAPDADFIKSPMMWPAAPPDGTIAAGGGFGGTQGLHLDGWDHDNNPATKVNNIGTKIDFGIDVTQMSFDYKATGVAGAGQAFLVYDINNDGDATDPGEYDTSGTLALYIPGWQSLTVGDGTLPYNYALLFNVQDGGTFMVDNAQLTQAAVPIPASLLLLGTGLLPLLRLRRKG